MTRSIEDVRQYWNARPCNVRHSSQPIGTPEYFEEVRMRKYTVEPHIIEFADYPHWRGKKILEVGCGIGSDTWMFANAGAHVTALDVSEESVNLAVKHCAHWPSTVTVGIADVERIQDYLPAQDFDLIYSFGVLHHTPHPHVALWKLRAYTNLDTELRIMVYNRWSWKAIKITRGRPWRNDLVARQSEAQSGCPITFAYSRRSARRMLRVCGYTVTALRVTHIFPYRVRDYVEGRLVRTLPARLLAPIWPFLESLVGWHLLVVARRTDVDDAAT